MGVVTPTDEKSLRLDRSHALNDLLDGRLCGRTGAGNETIPQPQKHQATRVEPQSLDCLFRFIFTQFQQSLVRVSNAPRMRSSPVAEHKDARRDSCLAGLGDPPGTR